MKLFYVRIFEGTLPPREGPRSELYVAAPSLAAAAREAQQGAARFTAPRFEIRQLPEELLISQERL